MIGCIIQARMGSSRLPGKTLMKVDEENTILDYVINQLSYSKLIDKIIIATTDLPEDDIICKSLISQKINFFRGSPENVLDRYFQCAKKYSIDTIIRITADNPLIDPNIVDLIINEYNNTKCDYMTNIIDRTFPYGNEVEVFSIISLEKAWRNAKKPSELEHVTPFIREPNNKFIMKNVKNKKNLSHLRYTVDRIEDIKLVKKITQNIISRPILIEDIINLYQKIPQIFEINKNVKHDGYPLSLEKDEQYFKSKNNERT
jgi:spore coat polysaccharide biosynthesis protein SpsF (cytidylyltransferase family)